MWHGRLALLPVALVGCSFAFAATPPDEQLIPKSQARHFDVAYEVNPNAQPLINVELWYTFDEGGTWHRYGNDPDKVSPIAFVAPREGLCGLYFVLTNAAGASGASPSANTEPQFWMFIDYTPPVSQIHAPQIEYSVSGRRVAHLSWSALDANLGPRPIDLSYRVLPDGAWMEVKRLLPNSGQYDWRIPEEVSGKLMFRLSVRDRGGHTSQSATGAVTVAPPISAADAPEEAADAVSASGLAAAPTPDELLRAQEALRKGRYHQLRGEHDLAIGRLRDALRFDPRLSEALVKLGASLYALGRYEESAGAYELALKQRPKDGEALEGMAQTLVALRRYDAAEAKLLAIVEDRPDNVEAWLHLGDVAIFRGDEIDAREYYMQAATRQPQAASVVARAKARLEDLPSLSRRSGSQVQTP